MKKLEKIVLGMAFVGIVVLFVTIERHTRQTQMLFDKVDSTLIKSDSVLQHAQRNIDSTNALLQELEQYR